MKYVMFETDRGQKLPVIFPDALTHQLMAMCIAAGIEVCVNSPARPVSAGFVVLGTDVEVRGESESLNMKIADSDAARIIIGDSISFTPDLLATTLLHELRKQTK